MAVIGNNCWTKRNLIIASTVSKLGPRFFKGNRTQLHLSLGGVEARLSPCLSVGGQVKAINLRERQLGGVSVRSMISGDIVAFRLMVGLEPAYVADTALPRPLLVSIATRAVNLQSEP